MSDSLSSQLMAALRIDADDRLRPKERHGTLDRLEEACNAIAAGGALAVVRDGYPDAAFNFRRTPVLVKPPRIEEYILARRGIDVQARRVPSPWVGPIATSIRKDAKLLEYVRTREHEQLALSPTTVSKSVERALDQIEDLGLRAELRFRLARARQSESDLRRLKDGMRAMRPTVDIDALIEGRKSDAGASASLAALVVVQDKQIAADLVTAVMKLTDARALAKCGLEFSDSFGNVIERKSRFELLTSNEVRALKKAAGVEV